MCNKEGHLCKECPQDTLPKLEVLPNITESWIQILTKTCLKVMGIYRSIILFIILILIRHLIEDSQQNKEEERIRNDLLEALYNIIKEKYEHVQLELFGSSNNGFGMKKSDLDICLTLKNHPPGEVK